MTGLEFGRLALPGRSDEEVEYALWNHTGFPAFGTVKSFWRSLGTYRRATDKGIRTCNFCRRGAETIHGDCRRCYAALAKVTT